jgi:hypothetical protein
MMQRGCYVKKELFGKGVDHLRRVKPYLKEFYLNLHGKTLGII